jgi:hypothetical protein
VWLTRHLCCAIISAQPHSQALMETNGHDRLTESCRCWEGGSQARPKSTPEPQAERTVSEYARPGTPVIESEVARASSDEERWYHVAMPYVLSRGVFFC